MKKKITVLTTCALLSALYVSAEAQQPKQVHRIGYLSAATAENDKNRIAAFQQGLHELGYIEGKNILIEQRYAAGQFEKIPELPAELMTGSNDFDRAFTMMRKERPRALWFSEVR
jgi:putative ABC transport system substrate-binding protein